MCSLGWAGMLWSVQEATQKSCFLITGVPAQPSMVSIGRDAGGTPISPSTGVTAGLRRQRKSRQVTRTREDQRWRPRPVGWSQEGPGKWWLMVRDPRWRRDGDVGTAVGKRRTWTRNGHPNAKNPTLRYHVRNPSQEKKPGHLPRSLLTGWLSANHSLFPQLVIAKSLPWSDLT